MSSSAALLHRSADLPPAAATDAVAAVLVGLLPRLYRVVVSGLHETPGVGEMTVAQFRVLGRLSEREYRAAELAAALGVGRPTLTAIADGLVRRGLVERRRELPGDRRGVLLRLTPAGRTAGEAIQRQAVATVGRLLADAQPDDLAALARGLAMLERGLPSCGASAKRGAPPSSAAGAPAVPSLSSTPHVPVPSASMSSAPRERTTAPGAPSAALSSKTASTRTVSARGHEGGQS